MQLKIQNLMRKRKMHDERIHNLLNNETSSSERSLSYKKKLEVENNNHSETLRSNYSKCSNLSRQVNLYAHLGTQSDKKIVQAAKLPDKRTLLKSLYKHFGENIEISLKPTHNLQKNVLLSENEVDFDILINYLDNNELWQEIFLIENGEFYVALDETKYLNQLQCISIRQLHQQEINLIIPDQQIINIGYLLLYRTLSLLKTGSAPQVLQKIFGYPYKSFNIQKTQQYFNCLKTISRIENLKDFIFIGKKLSDNRFQEAKDNFKRQNLQIKTLKYSQIVVINRSELDSKTISMAHKRNHHVVVDFQTIKKDTYIFTLKSQSKSAKYRFCIVDENLHILHHQIIKEGESCSIQLINSEFKVYLSKISDEEICKFNFIVQSKNDLSEVEINLKFIEEYNQFSRTLISKYIQSIDFNPVQNQIQRLTFVNLELDVIVIRVHLNFMEFYVDFLSFNPSKISSGTKVKIQYTEKQTFCDLEYKLSYKKIEVGPTWAFQIYLSKSAKLSSISGLKFTMAQLYL